MTDPRALIAKLNLAPHPEGGWYRETWRGPPGPAPEIEDGVPVAEAEAVDQALEQFRCGGGMAHLIPPLRVPVEELHPRPHFRTLFGEQRMQSPKMALEERMITAPEGRFR